MREIEGLSRTLTVIIIAHRLSTIATCDRVVELKAGRIHRQLSGDEISRIV